MAHSFPLCELQLACISDSSSNFLSISGILYPYSNEKKRGGHTRNRLIFSTSYLVPLVPIDASDYWKMVNNLELYAKKHLGLKFCLQ